MQIKNEYKLLPKVEVSFQDDFSGSKREVTLTPKFVIGQLNKLHIKPVAGDKILLWEKDDDKEEGDYLCNIGEISSLNKSEIEKYFRNEKLFPNEFFSIEGNPVFIKIERKNFFRLTSLE